MAFDDQPIIAERMDLIFHDRKFVKIDRLLLRSHRAPDKIR